MWRRFLAAGIFAFVALTIATPFVFAENPQSTVAMQGRTAGGTGTRITQIWLVSKSSDAQGWLLDIAISPQELVVERKSEAGRDREEEHEESRGEQVPSVKGSFTLGTQQKILSRGTFTGWLKADGKGNIQLSDPSGSTSLTMFFTITQGGVVVAMVEGHWPKVVPPQVALTAPQSNPTNTIKDQLPPINAPAVPTPAASTPSISVAAVQDQLPSVSAPAVSTLTTATNGEAVAQISGSAIAVSSATEQLADSPQPASHFYWYLSRTSAIVAYILLFVSICLGVGLKSRYLDPLWGRLITLDLHKFASMLGGGFIFLHVSTLLGDSYFKFTVNDLLVPMASPYRPFWTAMGIMALYTGALLFFSFYVRKIIRQKTWRIMHYGSYILFFVILFHGINTGTDTSAAWVQWLYVLTGTTVSFLLLWRITGHQHAEFPVSGSARIPAR